MPQAARGGAGARARRGGRGGAALGVGAAFGLRVASGYASAKDDCPPPHRGCSEGAIDKRERAGRDAWVANVGVGVGLAGVAGGEASGAGGAGGAGTAGGAGADAGVTPATRTLSAGVSFTCSLRDGIAYCWGQNKSGELGAGVGEPRPTPAPVVGPAGGALSGLEQVAAGGDHACALAQGGAVWCWGANVQGQLGRPGGSEPGPVTKGGVPLAGAQEIALGVGFSCARAGGQIVCWGANALGRLGRDETVTPGGPDQPFAPVAGNVEGEPLADARQIALGFAHACAIVGAEREVLCWGGNVVGQLGREGPGGHLPGPVASAPGGALKNVRQIAAGGLSTCALRDDGEVLCWGSNIYLQLGDGTTFMTARPEPRRVVEAGGAPLRGATSVAIGSAHACARRESGEVACWGSNVSGELGTGATSAEPFAAPLPVSLPLP